MQEHPWLGPGWARGGTGRHPWMGQPPTTGVIIWALGGYNRLTGGSFPHSEEGGKPHVPDGRHQLCERDGGTVLGSGRGAGLYNNTYCDLRSWQVAGVLVAMSALACTVGGLPCRGMLQVRAFSVGCVHGGRKPFPVRDRGVHRGTSPRDCMCALPRIVCWSAFCRGRFPVDRPTTRGAHVDFSPALHPEPNARPSCMCALAEWTTQKCTFHESDG